jgi:hypothetical protein
MLAPMTACPKPKPALHHITGVAYDSKTRSLLVRAAALEPRSVASACARFARSEFNEREQELRAMSPVARSMAFLRNEELRYVRSLVRFRPPSDKAVVEMTKELVPAN